MNKKYFCFFDFSINSTACSLYNYKNNKLIFFSFPRKKIINNNIVKNLIDSDVVVTIIDDKIITNDQQKKEIANLMDADYLMNIICNKLSEYIKDNNIIFGVEGISFGSFGNMQIQLAGYNYLLRYMLKNYFNITYDDILVYSPRYIKRNAGSGNYNKNMMIEKFINSNNDLLIDNKLQLALKNGIFVKKLHNKDSKTYYKPIDDLIDSFWGLVALMNNIGFKYYVKY